MNMKTDRIERPHIVYLHSHDTGRYIQPYGYAVETPNLQRFAEVNWHAAVEPMRSVRTAR
jgi:hypothetical protein